MLRKSDLPSGEKWRYELKLDGYRAISFKSSGEISLRSRNNKDFSARYPAIAQGLAGMPDESVVDGEVVALDETGRPSFNALQNNSSRGQPVLYYVFDLMMLSGRDLTREPLERRRQLLEEKVLPRVREPVRYTPWLDASLSVLIASVRAHGLEGVVAKRSDSFYEPGQRSGAWQKMRLNQAQEFVIGGYTVGNPFDALVFGYFENQRLIYAGKTRNGFAPASKVSLFKKFKSLEIAECPFVNLPEARSGRWGQGLTKEKMNQCRWLKPLLVGQFEFLEWTADNHLRHSRFVALREDRNARDVVRED
ncbi:MAG TPA: non-homologous end-joining DNA ligase [Terriglobia bacterium]|nr:non-homologous end-joining DNA ligase [Terriglobia bacterium]